MKYYAYIRRIIKKLGPGFITGASDDDPSGIATYVQTGALFGYSQLWMALFTTPLMISIQEMCGRIGLITGKGLAGVIKKYYSRPVLYATVTLLLIANTINIGADLGAMAAAGQLILNLPYYLLLIAFAGISIGLEILVPYKGYSKYLKYLTIALFAYMATAFLTKHNWSDIAWSTLVPTFSFHKNYLLNIVAILGTTISPYLFFWQTSEEVEEEVMTKKLKAMGHGTPNITNRDFRRLRVDTTIGMIFSNTIMFFIIISAVTLHTKGIFTIETAAQAAQILRPIAGEFAFIIFALGIIGTGLLAIPVLAGSASYALAETLGWKEGLNQKFKNAHGFYGVIIVATIIGVLINLSPIKPFTLLYYAAIINGFIAPPLLLMILLITNNKKIMNGHTNNRISNTFGFIIMGVMTVAGSIVLYSLLF